MKSPCVKLNYQRKKRLFLFFDPLSKQFEKVAEFFFFFCHGAMAAAYIFYANKKYFPRVIAILYLPCTF